MGGSEASALVAGHRSIRFLGKFCLILHIGIGLKHKVKVLHFGEKVLHLHLKLGNALH